MTIIVIYLIFLILILLFFVFFFLVIITNVIELFTTNAPFVPVLKGVENDIVENLQLDDNSVFYDLGCGDGRILKKSVCKVPNIKAIGIEVAIIPYIFARFLTKNNKQIKIRRENFFKSNISDATHIFMYLHPKTVNLLINKIKKECTHGTTIMSCDFDIKSCVPIKIVDLDNKTSKRCQKLFIYKL